MQVPQLLSLAHADERIDVPLTITRLGQARVHAVLFIDGLAVKVSKPSLYRPCRDQDEYAVVVPFDRNTAQLAGSIQTILPSLHSHLIAVHQNDERLAADGASAKVGKLGGKPVPHVLFARPAAVGSFFYSQLPRVPAGLLEKASGEDLLLSILAQQHDPDVSGHRHPRAIVSESFNPFST